MTQMLAQREHDYFAETVICANCYIVAKFFLLATILLFLATIFCETALRGGEVGTGFCEAATN